MLKIDVLSGTFKWGEYSFELNTPYEKFFQDHLELFSCQDSYESGGVKHVTFRLPTYLINEHMCTGHVILTNRYISAFYMRINEIEDREKLFDGKSAYWTKLTLWMQSMRSLLIQQLGEPTKVEMPHLHNEEDFLTNQQIEQLKTWEYILPWGTVRVLYSSEGLSSSLWIEYDHFQQITSWDELISECEYRIQVDKLNDETFATMLSATKELIQLVRTEFRYQEVLPTLFFNGLSLRKNAHFIRIDVEANPDGINYEVSRNDKVERLAANSNTIIAKIHEIMNESK